MLNSYQEHLAMEPNVMYAGPVTLDGVEMNEFWLRDGWVPFYLRRDAFDGMRPGHEIESIHGSGQAETLWVWPHEIVWFFRDVASTGLLEVLGSAREAPELIQKLWQRIGDSGALTQETARLFTSRDALVWRNMFGRIGTDREIQRLRPDIAYWARVLGEVAGVENEPVIPLRDEAPGDVINDLVAMIAVGFTVIGIATSIAGFLINFIIIAAGALGAVAPWALKAITVGAIVFIALVAIAWAIVVLLTIIGMIVIGVLAIIKAWSRQPAS